MVKGKLTITKKTPIKKKTSAGNESKIKNSKKLDQLKSKFSKKSPSKKVEENSNDDSEGEKDIYKCTTCLIQFKKYEKLVSHYQSLEHQEKGYPNFKFECKPCRRKFRTKYKLERHSKTNIHLENTGATPPKKAKSKNKVAKESPAKSNLDHYCTFCKLNFDSGYKIKRHYTTNKHKYNEKKRQNGGKEDEDQKEKNEIEEKDFKKKLSCNLCKKEYTQIWQFNRHLNTPGHKEARQPIRPIKTGGNGQCQSDQGQPGQAQEESPTMMKSFVSWIKSRLY